MSGQVITNGPVNQAVEKQFRVIVVGGGVTGLAASHVLSKAGIDHVVLERGKEAAPTSGASIAIYPHGARILEQISVLQAMLEITSPMDRLVNRRPDGSELTENDYWGHIKENHEYELMFFERREFLQVLYDGLPNKSRVLLNKKVVDIKEEYDGVEVLLSDGTSEKGDIVIGCDGVHSLVRQRMWENADRKSPGLITVKERKTMTISWTCLLGMGPGEPALRSELSCVHNDGYSFLIGTQPNRTFFFVFFRVKKPYSQYTRPRWSDEDAEKAALSVADHPISPNLVFGDIWRRRYRAQIVDIEEGVLSHWFFGRTVLVGDAAHKVTPNIALGGNSGMESIALLSSLLHRELTAHPKINPSRSTLIKLFQQYQDQRIPRMKKILEFSNLITRIQAWDGWLMKAVAIWGLPYQKDSKLGEEIGEIIKGGEKLDFVPIKSRIGKIRWDDEGASKKEVRGAIVDAKSGWKEQKVSVLVLLLALSSILWVFSGAVLSHLRKCNESVVNYVLN